MRIFTISDVHTNYQENRQWLTNLSDQEYQADALIVAGDVHDQLTEFISALDIVRQKFARVCVVPGNHDLWLKKEQFTSSIDKFLQLLKQCETLGVDVRPVHCGVGQARPVWIVPLFSWYTLPEQGKETLYWHAEDMNDQTMRMWADNYQTAWPPSVAEQTPAGYFAQLNQSFFRPVYTDPVITFSHFMPRQELIFSTREEWGDQPYFNPHPTFNFSRVAGSQLIEQQIRQLGAVIHVYGHQHRNRDRWVDGVRYISHCLGYPRERAANLTRGVTEQPKLIWDTSD